VVAQNLPGAGGVRLLEYLVSQAPKDGTAPAAFASGPLVEQLVGPRKPAYGIADFAASARSKRMSPSALPGIPPRPRRRRRPRGPW
jgi:tripartite-type tricarboxylate transporter receptor subunit TctC